MPCLRARLLRPVADTPRSFLLAALLLASASVLAAQAPVATPSSGLDQPYTLHVYERVIQVPTLVLDPSHRTFTHPIEANRFDISLDSGPRFHPTSARFEGDDPISLAVLVDATGTPPSLYHAIPSSIAAWVGASFKSQDRISIYAVDCGLARTALAVPPDPAALAADVRRAIDSPIAHRAPGHSSCSSTFPLWSSLVAVMKELMAQPGRRVILYIGSTYNGSGSLSWDNIHLDSVSTGVTIFGLTQLTFDNLDGRIPSDQAVFRAVCESSGGLFNAINAEALPASLSSIVDLIRGRYILEFPTPFNPSQGLHNIRISIVRLDAFVQPAGVSMTIPDPALDKDPSTVPSNQSNAPQMGKRRSPH
jgi:hypothetical protein